MRLFTTDISNLSSRFYVYFTCQRFLILAEILAKRFAYKITSFTLLFSTQILFISTNIIQQRGVGGCSGWPSTSGYVSWNGSRINGPRPTNGRPSTNAWPRTIRYESISICWCANVSIYGR